jgi:hypothetical protein
MVKTLIVLENYYEVPEKEPPHTRKGIFISEDGKKYIGKPRPNVCIGSHYTVEVYAEDLNKPLIPISKWITK